MGVAIKWNGPRTLQRREEGVLFGTKACKVGSSPLKVGDEQSTFE